MPIIERMTQNKASCAKTAAEALFITAASMTGRVFPIVVLRHPRKLRSVPGGIGASGTVVKEESLLAGWFPALFAGSQYDDRVNAKEEER